jgi:hypothetical protein
MRTSRTARTAPRRLATAAAALAVVASLAACNGDSGGGSGSAAPDDASRDDFCSAFNSLFDTVLSSATSGGDIGKAIAALKEWAADIEDVGTPADMPDDARHGFELFVEQAKGLDEDASMEELQNLGEDLSEADQADGEAFGDWTTKNCPLDLPGDLGELTESP